MTDVIPKPGGWGRAGRKRLTIAVTRLRPAMPRWTRFRGIAAMASYGQITRRSRLCPSHLRIRRPARSACRILLIITIALAAVFSRGDAAEPRPAKQPGTLRELIDAAVNDIQLYSSIDGKEPARPVVVLRWANNARGSEDGTTVLYIDRGRPLAVLDLYPWAGSLARDFELLSNEGIVGRRKNALIWQPQKAEVQFADVPDAPPPEATAAQRLRQIRSLSGQFQSTMLGWKSDDTDREELRLLPRPLYRYELSDDQVKDGPLIDGAVFAFVMGTDPESLLLLEAVKNGEASKWRFAFARRTSGGLEGRHRGKVVWTAARFPYERHERSPHYVFDTPLPPELSDDKSK